MASLMEVLPPFRILAEGTDSNAVEGSWNPTDAVIFVAISLVLGIASRHLLRGTRVPYTVALLVIGIALGSLGSPLSFDLFSDFFLSVKSFFFFFFCG